ncbi:MAG: PEGA domain-containing protein [Candidatus Poribacteria bacterium]|nr:PEGA domain-containing protein [Candidatus Poribacteria bacterium]
MSAQKIVAIILVVCLSSSAFWQVSAEPIDAGTYWLMVDATPDAEVNAHFKTLSNLLIEKGKVNKDNIRTIQGSETTKDGIENALIDTENRSGKIETIIFLYHGEVSMPPRENAMHLSTQSDETIKDSILNQWFSNTGIGRILVIIDGYAYEESLTVYYANRDILGTAALNVIHPAETTEATGKNSFLHVLIDVLSTETIDSDDNRHISVIEIYQQIQTDNPFENAIFAPTGEVDQTVMKLSPAINVTSFPEEAEILLNEEANGLTPKLFTENLQQGTYTVSVRKVGYNSPEPKTAELKLTQGEVINFGWALKPISVFGSVTGPTDMSVVGTEVSLDGTEYVEIVGEDGGYSFQDWKASEMLSPGTAYTLYAKLGDFYHGSATFTFDGYMGIEQPIKLVKKTWFEIAELEFSRSDHQKAVEAFQNGIEDTTDFPEMSAELTVLLLSTFANAIDRGEINDVNYMVVTAKLAEVYQQPDVAKKYWSLVKLNAQKGTPEAKLAGQRLWQMNRWRHIINIGIVCLSILIIASGIWTFFRYRKSKQTETEIDA